MVVVSIIYAITIKFCIITIPISLHLVVERLKDNNAAETLAVEFVTLLFSVGSQLDKHLSFDQIKSLFAKHYNISLDDWHLEYVSDRGANTLLYLRERGYLPFYNLSIFDAIIDVISSSTYLSRELDKYRDELLIPHLIKGMKVVGDEVVLHLKVDEEEDQLNPQILDVHEVVKGIIRLIDINPSEQMVCTWYIHTTPTHT